MKTAITFLFTFFSFSIPALSQNCSFYYFQNNKTVTLGMFNNKGAGQGKIVYTISNVTKSGSNVKASINTKMYDKKDKLTSEAEGEAKCNAGILMMDMRMMMPQQNAGIKKTDVEAKGDYMEYPSNMKAGQKLKDGKFEMNFVMNGGMRGSMSVDVTDRVVEEKETVKTPAGSWEAYKINYTAKFVMNMGFAIPMTMDITEWFVPDFGIVKSYSKSSTMELLSIE